MNKTSGKSKVETSKATPSRSTRGPIVSTVQRQIIDSPKIITVQSKAKSLPGAANINVSKQPPIVSQQVVSSIPASPGTSMNTSNNVFKRKLGGVSIVPCITVKSNETYVPVLTDATGGKGIVKTIAIPVSKPDTSNGCLYVTNQPPMPHIYSANMSITPVNSVKLLQMSSVTPKGPQQQKKFRCSRCKKLTENPKFCDNCQSVTSSSQIVKASADSQKVEQAMPVTSKTPTIISKDKFYKPTAPQIVTTSVSGNTFSSPATTRKIFVVPDQQGKARGRPKGSKNRVTEPECLTILSSDEENEDDNLQTLEASTATSPQMLRRNSVAYQRAAALPSKVQVKTNTPAQQRRSYRLGRSAIEHVMELEDGEVIDDEDEEEVDDEEEEPEDPVLATSRIPLPGEAMPDESTTLRCRSIRIGSFKIHPLNESPHILVQVTQDSFTFQVSKVTKLTELTSITLRGSDISKVLGHFGRCLPIMFIFTTPVCATRIRKQLGMEKGGPYYYDPEVEDDKQKKITLLIDNMTDDLRTFLRGQFPGEGILTEIDQKAANEILVKSTPSHQTMSVKNTPQPAQSPSTTFTVLPSQPSVVMTPAQIQIQSSQLTVQPIQNVMQALQSTGTVTVSVSLQAINPKEGATTTDLIPKIDRPILPVRKIVTYPPPPETDSIELNTGDLVCLNEEEFLNDKIIDFYLRYLVLEKLEEKDRERTHVFNSYFYRGLTQKPNKRSSEDRQKSIAELRHRQVKKWTKNLNIFEKDFIIIPINQNAHWFLAIICYPSLASEVKRVTKPLPSQSDNATSVNQQSNDGASTTSQIIINTISPIKATRTREQADDSSECSSTENSPSEDFQSANEESDGMSTRKSDLPDSAKPTPGQKMPFIIIFDSLPGPSRTHIGKTLKEYLEWEWKLKKGNTLPFDTTAILHGNANVPQQQNFSDCGIYVLQYVESFFEDPFPYIAFPLPDMRQWFSPEKVASKREEIRTLIYELEKRLTPNSSSVNNANAAKNEDNTTNSTRNS